MVVTISKTISGIIALAGMVYVCIKFNMEFDFYYFIFVGVVLVLIWFPDAVNTYTVGMWVDGYKIESPTPPIMISAFGWILLLSFNVYLFW